MADTNDIDALLGYLSICADRYSCHTLPSDVAVNYRAALTALVAERDALKQRVAELEPQGSSELSFCERRDRAWAEELRPATPAAPVPQPPSDLRERLVCAALQGAGCATIAHQPAAELLGRQAVWLVDGALAEMRKGEQP